MKNEQTDNSDRYENGIEKNDEYEILEATEDAAGKVTYEAIGKVYVLVDALKVMWK